MTVCQPEDIVLYFQEAKSSGEPVEESSENKVVKGYRVKVKYQEPSDQEQKQREVAQVVAKSIQRMKKREWIQTQVFLWSGKQIVFLKVIKPSSVYRQEQHETQKTGGKLGKHQFAPIDVYGRKETDNADDHTEPQIRLRYSTTIFHTSKNQNSTHYTNNTANWNEDSNPIIYKRK